MKNKFFFNVEKGSKVNDSVENKNDHEGNANVVYARKVNSKGAKNKSKSMTKSLIDSVKSSISSIISDPKKLVGGLVLVGVATVTYKTILIKPTEKQNTTEKNVEF
ncbi:hypothetical protein RFI_06928 [Reticulomyxa filosa]|uniref:Uncharacterized protein n=1 Tax=Reticulomyxa filosa TaxID=46433 RepID=X6NY22_RETFI|nr:hypothetical protein RFI_06928 [Reticulomyxa filosa]|eukprot:ETO30187.1 hypothetical protein RFI_06928 [Reticulomyxa filosa]